MNMKTDDVRIRRAESRDIPGLIVLLKEILELHAALRPDLFIPGTAKYTENELEAILRDSRKPVYVAVNRQDAVIGYAFCQLQDPKPSNCIRPFRSVYIDDLCVDASFRGRRIGEMLFDHVKSEARRLGCYEITLNVWSGNDGAERFYEKMGMKTKEKQMEYILSDP